VDGAEQSDPAHRRAWRRLLGVRFRARRNAEGAETMDVKSLESMPGMPAGFPFAMVLIGIGLAIFGTFCGGINEYFFRSVANGFVQTGLHLIMWGSVIQGVLWIVTGFGRKSSPPPSAP
jgi:hypothetical protein